MNNTLNSALLFLTDTVLNIFIFILLIRFLLAIARTNYFHPLTQFIVKFTDWLIKPTRRIIPNIKTIETASLIWVLVLETLKLFAVDALSVGMPSFLGIFILAFGETLYYICQIYIFAIIIECVLSFIQPHAPANYILQQFTSPIMRPVRRVIPVVSGIDISPIPAIILLQLVVIVVVNPIMLYGIGLAY